MNILKNIFFFITSRLFSYFYAGFTLILMALIVVNFPENLYLRAGFIILYFIVVIWFYIYITDKFSRKKISNEG
jgi:hypothetical protein